MVCKNCEASFEGKFCSNCGQKADTHRITMKHFFHELFHAFTHTDKGILLLAKDLLARPGHVAREYVDGKRKKYFNPISFLVITAAITAFVVYESGYFKAMSTRPASTQQTGVTTPPSEGRMKFYKLMGEAGAISIKNEKLLELFLIFPLMGLATWTLFGNKRANFAENLVLNAFIMGQSNVAMTVIFIPAFLIGGEATARMNNNIFHGIFVIYMVVAYQQFFKQHVVFTILKSILVMIFYILFYWLLIAAYVLIKHQIMEP